MQSVCVIDILQIVHIKIIQSIQLLFLNELAMCFTLFLHAHETYIFYGMCTVTKCIIAIVNDTFCY